MVNRRSLCASRLRRGTTLAASLLLASATRAQQIGAGGFADAEGAAEVWFPSHDYYDVRSYHAPQDPDWTTAFQQAIDEAAAAGGGTVIVPYGAYSLGSTIYIHPGVTLEGVGARPTLQPLSTHLQLVVPEARSTLRHLRFSGHGQEGSVADYLVYHRSDEQHPVERVAIIDCQFADSGRYDLLYIGEGFREFTVRDCQFSGAGRNNLTIKDGDGAHISGCMFFGQYGFYNVDVEAGADLARNIEFLNCLFDASTTDAFEKKLLIANASSVTVAHCTLLGGDAAGGIGLRDSSHITVADSDLEGRVFVRAGSGPITDFQFVRSHSAGVHGIGTPGQPHFIGSYFQALTLNELSGRFDDCTIHECTVIGSVGMSLAGKSSVRDLTGYMQTSDPDYSGWIDFSPAEQGSDFIGNMIRTDWGYSVHPFRIRNLDRSVVRFLSDMFDDVVYTN